MDSGKAEKALTNAPLVVEKTLKVLEYLATCNELTAGVTEISALLGYNKSTVYRILRVLADHGFVERNPRTQKYSLGVKILELGTAYLTNCEVRKQARPFLDKLVEDSGETVHLAVLRDWEVVYLDRVEPPNSGISVGQKVGRRFPAYCTAGGKAMLAWLPEEQMEQFLTSVPLKPMTPKTITDAAELRRELARVRERGYAVDLEEIHEWGRCVGAPIFDFSGGVVAAVSVSGLSMRLTDERIRTVLAPLVMEAAYNISSRLGYRKK